MISAARLDQFRQIAHKILKPLTTTAKALEERKRLEIEQKLEKKLGVAAQRRKIQKLDEALEVERVKLTRIVGYQCGNRRYTIDSPFGREVEAQLASFAGSPALAAAMALIDEVDQLILLSEAPMEIAAGLRQLGAEVAKLAPALERQLKALLPSQSKDEEED
jgi:hypothetical protein